MTATHVTVTGEFPDQTIGELRRKLDRGTAGPSLRELQKLINAAAGGVDKHTAYMRVVLASACSTGTVTCDRASTVDDTDTVTIGGTALAVKASPTTTAQFAKGASDTAMATNLANCINANATLAKIVRASSSAGVVTITCLYPGPIGDLVTLAETGNGMGKSGAALASGSSDAPDSYQLGYTPSV